MPLSYATFTGNSGSPQHTFTIPYNYILKDHIKVYYGRDILANTQTALLVSGTDYNFTSDTTIQLIGSTLNSGTTTGNPHNLADGVVLTLERDTPDSSQIVEFADGSNLIGDNLNNANLQNLFVVQEQQDKNDLSAAKAISSENAANTATNNVATLTATQFKTDGSTPMTGDINANSNKIKNLADPTNAQDGVTKAYLERSGSITSTQIADGTIVNADVNASAAIAQSKLDIANATQAAAGYQSATDKAKLDGIEPGATADQTDAEIRSLVESASDSNVFTDNDHTKLDGIEPGATADQTDAEIRAAVEAASDSNVFTDNDHNKLNAIEPGATADQNASEIKTLYESNSNTNPLTDAEKAVIDGVTANTSELNKLDGFTGSVADLNEVVTGKNVVEQITGSATDAQIPTAQAVNERVVELVTEVGGFHPIANETSFPTTNPDINDGAGTIVSLKALTNSFSTGSGVTTHTFTNGTGAGNNVTINGLPSNTTFQAGKGLLLETTTTLHTYTYHRLVLDESGVSNADALVSAFNERYYGPLSSNPATRPSGANRQNGDLYFNNSDGKMKVYNGTHASGTWDDVAAPGNFFINTISSSSGSGGGSATFNNTATRFTLSNPPNEAQQLLVSINGVIQKPNTGTSPSEGFAVDGADIIFAAAPPTGSSYFIVTIGSSVNIGTPSDNTVTSAKIVDGSIVNGDISGSAAIQGTKISPNFGSQQVVGANVNLISGTPTITFEASSNNPDYMIQNQSGKLIFQDTTNSANRLVINTNGHIDVTGDLDVGGQLEVTGHSYLENLTLTASTPSLNMVSSGADPDFMIQNQSGKLILQDTTNSVNRLVINSDGHIDIAGNLDVAGNITVSNASPEINLVDSGDNPDYRIRNQDGTFRITDTTNNAGRFVINSDGHIDVVGNLDVGAGLDVIGLSTFDAGNVTNALHIQATGSYNLYSYHDSGGVGWATGAGGSFGELLYLDDNGSTVRLYTGGLERLRAHSSGVTVSGRLTTDSLNIVDDGSNSPLIHLSQDDSSPWAFVLSNQTYHDSADSGLKHYVANSGEAVTQIRGNSEYKQYTLTNSNGTAGYNLLQLTTDHRVKLYHQGAAKCQTGSSGLEIIEHTDIRFLGNGNWTGEGTPKIQHHSNRLYFIVGTQGFQMRDQSGSAIMDVTASGGFTGKTLTLDQDVQFNGGAGAVTIRANSDIRFTSGTWTGETAAKIQYHSNHIYYQSTSQHNFRNAGGSNTFVIDSSGNFSSDERKKENITTVTNALTKVSQLRGVEFKWKEKYGNKEDMGLIAQEVETVLPRLISDSPDPEGAEPENEDGTPMKMMNYNGLFSVMVEAVKELKAKVEVLEAKVATLEGS